MTKKIYIILILVLCLLPIFRINAQNSRAGFIPGDIWYSQEQFEEGDKIKIYTALFNPDQREFSGTVIFFDKDIFLGKKTFKIKQRTVKDISIDWTVGVGSHTIFAKIENAKFLMSDGTYEEVYLSGNQTEESKHVVKKKIIPKTSSEENEKIIDNLKENVSKISSESIGNIGKIVEEKIPSVIVKPIITTVNFLEELRTNIANSSQNSKEIVKKELEELKNKKTGEGEDNGLKTPFKYIKLFLLSLVSFIFSQKIIFYILSLIIIFYIFRFIWRLIF